MLRLQMLDAWEKHGRGAKAFDAMGRAYVGFAVANPSHYRVMFGGRVQAAGDDDLAREGAGAFQVLVDAIATLQSKGEIRDDERLRLAQFIWATVHGIAMMAIDGLLDHQHTTADALVAYANERMRTGISR